MKRASRVRRFQSGGDLAAAVGGATYLYGNLHDEDRARVPEQIQHAKRILPEGALGARVVTNGAPDVTLQLRNSGALEDFVRGLADPIHLDITGMPYGVWVPILRAVTETRRKLNVIYVEPNDYRRNPSPASVGEMFDLSETTRGVEPLPGFSRIAVDDDDECIFVPILGFEGARLLHIAESLELREQRTVPIIPAPGFRAEYVSYTLACNRELILGSKCWSSIRYAAANHPFDVLEHLGEIAATERGTLLRVALTGTKPHALGAVLHALRSQSTTELIYDHPVERASRTTGVGGVSMYLLTDVLSDD